MRNKQTYSRFIQNVLPWNEFNKGRMIQFLHHCVEHDITAFENFDYTDGKYIGKLFGVALSESGLSRDEIQLISKYGSPETEGNNLVETVDQILLDLETDYLDLLLLDYPNLTSTNQEAIERLMAQGKVVEVGGLNLKDIQMRDFEIPLAVNQVFSPFASPRGLTPIPAQQATIEEILPFVWCSNDIRYSEGVSKVLKDLCAQYKVSEYEFILIWILQHPTHLHPVINSKDKEEIVSAVNCRKKYLDPVDWQKVQLVLS